MIDGLSWRPYSNLPLIYGDEFGSKTIRPVPRGRVCGCMRGVRHHTGPDPGRVRAQEIILRMVKRSGQPKAMRNRYVDVGCLP
jgi:hypothetical protein